MPNQKPIQVNEGYSRKGGINAKPQTPPPPPPHGQNITTSTKKK